MNIMAINPKIEVKSPGEEEFNRKELIYVVLLDDCVYND